MKHGLILVLDVDAVVQDCTALILRFLREGHSNEMHAAGMCRVQIG
jgi:hypothetical protein